MRRAATSNKSHVGAASKSLEGLREVAGIAEKLQPYLAEMKDLQAELEGATQLLRAIQGEHNALQAAMVNQREIFLRMFARGMGVPLDTVLSMESEIQHAFTSPQSDTEVSTEDPGA